jgi:hypothetical protein
VVVVQGLVAVVVEVVVVVFRCLGGAAKTAAGMTVQRAVVVLVVRASVGKDGWRLGR